MILPVLSMVLLAACDCALETANGARDERAPAPEVVERTFPAPDERGCVPGAEPLPADVQRGVCLAHNWQDRGARGYGTASSAAQLEELSELGVGWLSLTPFAFMRAPDDPEIRLVGSHAGGERDEVVVRQIEQARAAGMRVLLKPHIWIRGGVYRGEVAMDDEQEWERFFAAYERYILHYARMAQEHGVEILAVGVELDRTVDAHPERWREIVATVREVYDGELVYSANWDRVLDFPLWDVFDYVGVQFYPPLADEAGATDQALRGRMEHYASVLDGFHARVDRPILFTEVGYRSVRHAELRPHAWPEREEGRSEVDEATQAHAYALFLDVMGRRPWTAGIYWWKWFTDPGTDEEGPTGFSPRDKLAEAVLASFYGDACR